jgi:transcription-repair coupling factor (superfamily II helicase)
MNVSGLLAWFHALPAYRALREELHAGGAPPALGLLRAARPALLAALSGDLDRPILIVAGSVERARGIHQSLRHWHPDPTRILRFPEPPAVFYERAPWPRETVAGRMAVLCRLASPEEERIASVVVASARALMQPTLPLQQFRLGSRTLHVGQPLDLEETLRRWMGLGYDPSSVVEGPGQFSHRGGILDVFPPADPAPLRIELFGSQIESVRRFDPATQRSEARLEAATILPAREPLPRHGPRVAEELAAWFEDQHPPEAAEELAAHRESLSAASPFAGLEFYLPYFYSHPASLVDYLPSDGLLMVDDLADLADAWAGLEAEAVSLREAAERERTLPPDYPVPYLTWDDLQEGLADRPPLILGYGEEGAEGGVAAHFRPGSRYGGQLGSLLGDVEKTLLAGERVVIASRQARRLGELWAERHDMVLPVEDLQEPPRADLTLVHGALEEGWVLSGADRGFRRAASASERQDYGPGPASEAGTTVPILRLLTDAEIFGWRMPEPRRPIRRRRVAPESLYADLTPGDVVTHVDYGIGIFRGLVAYTLQGEEREYLLVEYAGRDRLYVPIYQADRLTRYVGADDRPPTLSRLGSAEWAQVKARARRAVEEIARELLELYAAREVAPGHAFGADTPWQAELEAAFPYLETPDQARAIAQVKADMERARPMDRLICGDAGYGKTEVALRAAFKAVLDGKQVAILVPTTVLAQQHYTTFRHRLTPFPVAVEMLSRFRTSAEQARILEGLRAGDVDIVIGTHRLLQKDVALKDLGLVIIDEEQRFGVTHKERLKRMRTEVDVLTMTATPIPRTLYLSLTGVRDISVIETPPEERLPAATYVGAYDPNVVRRAVLREIDRSGQVFYVHNRVQTIEAARRRLVRLMPEAKVAVAHGQMRERDLERVMLRFVSGEVDVLLCTSIIESGLDIPNANTLIVEQAERFGLAQLYQLRGRVGRGARLAHAYFFYSPGRRTVEARERLETIREASELGAGYSIAMRDLELRGAGEILGTRQSGHIAAIGFDLYTRLLSRAVEELRARREGRSPPPEPLSSIRLDLPLPVGLPPDYVSDTHLRLRLYRRLANLGDLDQIREMEVELEDRFGSLPELARNLMLQLRFKVLAREAGVQSILVESDHLVLRADWLEKAGRVQIRVRLGDLAYIGRRELRFPLGEGWQERLQAVLAALRRERSG